MRMRRSELRLLRRAQHFCNQIRPALLRELQLRRVAARDRRQSYDER